MSRSSDKFEDALIGYPKEEKSFLTPSQIGSGDNITLQHLDNMLQYYKQHSIIRFSPDMRFFDLSGYKAYLSGTAGLGPFDPGMSSEDKLRNYRIIYDDLRAQLCKQLLDAAIKGEEETVTKLLKAGVSVLDSPLKDDKKNTFSTFFVTRTFDKKKLSKKAGGFDPLIRAESFEGNRLHIDFLMHGAYVIALAKKGKADAAVFAIEKGLVAVLDEFRVHNLPIPDMTSIRSAFIEHADVNTILKVDQYLQFSEPERCNCLIRYIKNKDFDSAFQFLKAKKFDDLNNIYQIKHAFVAHADEKNLLFSRLYVEYSSEDFNQLSYPHSRMLSRGIRILLTTKLGMGVEDTLWNRYQENCKNLIKELSQSINALVADPNLSKIIMEKLAPELTIIANDPTKLASERLFKMLETIVETYNNFPLFQSRLSRFFSGPPSYKNKLSRIAQDVARKIAAPTDLNETGQLTLTLKEPDESVVSVDKPSSPPTPSAK